MLCTSGVNVGCFSFSFYRRFDSLFRNYYNAFEEFKNIHDITCNIAVTDVFGLGRPCLIVLKSAVLREFRSRAESWMNYISPAWQKCLGFAFLHEFDVFICVYEIQDEEATSLVYAQLSDERKQHQQEPSTSYLKGLHHMTVGFGKV